MQIASKSGAYPLRRTLLPLLSSLLLLGPVNATIAATQLGEVNVTANRMAITVDETLAAVNVITREDIEKSQAKDLVQLLSAQPGVVTRSAGGLGKTSNILVRGTTSSHLLVMIDGVRVGSATLGQAPFQDIPLAQIERIEIVRGPRSQLYGSDAIGGVLQIFTRKGGESTLVDAELGYGSHRTVKGTAGVSGQEGSTNFSLRLSHLQSDGFNAYKNNNPDDDGYRNNSIALQLGHEFDSGAAIALNFLRSEGNNEYDSQWGAGNLYDTDFIQQSIGVNFSHALTEWWGTTLTAGHGIDKTTNFTNKAYASNFDTLRKQVSWQNDFMLGEASILTLGTDFLREEVEGSSTYSVSERDTIGLFVQYQTELVGNDVTIGIRHDDIDTLGNHINYNLAIGRQLSDQIRVIAAYGTAFKAPTFNDLYYQDPWGSNGNPNLEPEESSSIELGIVGTHGWGGWDARLFRTDVDKLIQWVETPPGSWIYRPQNVNKARIDGLELSANTQLAGWELSASFTYLDPEDTSTGLLLVKRSEMSLRLNASKQFGPYEIGANFEARSESFADTANTSRAAGYGIVDLFAARRLGSDWVLRGQVTNLFDNDYEDIPGYNTAGRELFVSIGYQPR